MSFIARLFVLIAQIVHCIRSIRLCITTHISLGRVGESEHVYKDVTEFESESECCWILTIFVKFEVRRIYRLIAVGFRFSLRFVKLAYIIQCSPLLAGEK